MKLKIFLNSLFLLASCKFAFASFHDVEGIYHIQQVDEYDQSMNEFKTNPEGIFQNPLVEVTFIHHFTFIELKSNHEYTYGIDVDVMVEAKAKELAILPFIK